MNKTREKLIKFSKDISKKDFKKEVEKFYANIFKKEKTFKELYHIMTEKDNIESRTINLISDTIYAFQELGKGIEKTIGETNE